MTSEHLWVGAKINCILHELKKKLKLQKKTEHVYDEWFYLTFRVYTGCTSVLQQFIKLCGLRPRVLSESDNGKQCVQFTIRLLVLKSCLTGLLETFIFTRQFSIRLN